MSNSKTPGLFKRNGIYHIDKRSKYFPGGRLRRSTGTADLQQAKDILNHKLDEARKAHELGTRPKHSFEQAAIQYLHWNQQKTSIIDDGLHLQKAIELIGQHRPIDEINSTLLQRDFITPRQAAGIKSKSINNALGVIRHLLNQAATEWHDDYGMTWLAHPPKIKLLKVTDAAKAYPLDWQEQARLLKELPDHLAEMALFKVNTGNREQNVLKLKWDWEVQVPELATSVFIVPNQLVKNDEERLTVLNRTARSIIDRRRTQRPTRHTDNCAVNKRGECNCAYSHVFTYKGLQVQRIRTNAWVKAWEKAGLPMGGEYKKGVHNLRHTFSRRLRAAGVNRETRQALLGHKNDDITTHYSAAELKELLNAVELLCDDTIKNQPTLTLLKLKASA